MRVAKVLKVILIGVPILLIALIAGAVVALKYTDFNQYKPLIAEEVRKATGRDLAISGDLRLDISLTPGIVVDGVTLSNAKWGSRPEMATVERLEAKIALTSLFFGILEVKRIELIGADILLETDRQGRANFEFEAPEAVTEEGKEPEEAGAGIGAIPMIHEAVIRDSRLTYVSAATGVTYRIAVESLTLRGDGPGEPLGLVYTGSYNDAPIEARATLGALTDLLEPGKPWPVDLTVGAGGAVVTVKGGIAEPLTAEGFDLAIEARGDQLGDISVLAGAEIPSLGAYSLAARVTGGAGTVIELTRLKAKLGESELTGRLSVNLAGEQPAIVANLASDKIDLTALGAGVEATLHNAAAALSLKGGKLEIESINVNLSGAEIAVTGTIADPATAGGLDLAVTVRGDRIGDLSELAGAKIPTLGAYALSTRVTGDLASTITLAGLKAQLGESDVAGEVTLRLAGEHPVVGARLASRKIDLAALGAGVNAPLQDVTSVFSVQDGKLNIESFKANLSGATISVKGTITGPAEGKGLNLAVAVAGNQTSDLSALAGAKVPALGAYSLSARVTGDAASTIKLVGLKAQVGASDLAGEVTVTPVGERPAIDAKLASRQIDLAALGAGVNAKLQDTVTVLSLKNGKLDIGSLKTTLAGATITVNGTITDAAAFEGLNLAVAARGDRFGDLSKRIGGKVLALGGYSLAARVTGGLASAIDISGLAVQLGGSDISGDVKVTLSGKHPAIDARLTSGKIDLAALGAGNAPLRGTVAVFSLKDQKLFIESIEANLSGAVITVEGTIAEPAKARGLDLSIAARGEQFADLSGLVGAAVPALGSYTISTRVTGDATAKIRSSEFTARVGESDLAGSATVTLTGERPFIDATLSSKKIDLAFLGATAGDGAGRQEAKPERIFPDDPLPLEGLKAIDADLRFDAVTVTGQGPSLRNAAVILSLRGGLLDIESFKAELYDGALEGAVRIDSRTEPAGLVAKVVLRKIDLGPLLEQTAAAGAIEGRVNFDLDVTGKGNTVRAIMASLDGRASLAMGKGRIKSRTLQILVGGPTRILSNVLTLNVGGYTTVDCALGAFDIEQGLATSSGILLDTDVAAFVGTGTVNLGTEALDMIIDPKVKKMTLSTAVPVHIRGTLANPEYSLDKTAVARRVGGLLGGIFFPPALILGLGELGTFEDGNCIEQADSSAVQSTTDQPEKTPGKKPSSLPGKILKGTGETITKGLKGLFGR